MRCLFRFFSLESSDPQLEPVEVFDACEAVGIFSWEPVCLLRVSDRCDSV